MKLDNQIERFEAKHVVCANGPLSTPRMPELGGMELFSGESFHTAKWNKDTDLKGKNVGIIGTGASAAQVITSIADEVGETNSISENSYLGHRERRPTHSSRHSRSLQGRRLQLQTKTC